MSVLPLNSGGPIIGGAISTANEQSVFGTHISHLGIGGLVELPTIEYRNTIPVDATMNNDGLSCGRRKLGMVVYVINEKKYYQLRPKISDTEVTYTQWTGYTGAEKIVLLDPLQTEVYDEITDTILSGSGDADDAWVEVFNFVNTPTLTINNNTDNYIFASSGTADTIEGQSGLTWNGTTLSVSGDTNTSGESYMASATVRDLTQNRVVVAGVDGALTNYTGLTFDNTTLSTTKDFNVDGNSTLATVTVENLTQNRVVVAGVSGALIDYSGLTFNNTTLITTKNVEIGGTLDVNGESTLASATVEDLTQNRILVAGSGGSLVDYSGLTFDNTTLRTTKNAEVGGTLTVTGNTTANAFYQSSSRTLKTNIEKLEISGLDLLSQVNVVKFNYLNDLENKRIGFIAEDTPIELSTKEQNVMDTNSSIGLLIKAVQELSDKVKELESRLK